MKQTPQQKLFLKCGVPQGSGTSTIFFIWKLSQKHFKSPRSTYVCRRCKSFIHPEKYGLTNGQELITKNESLNLKKVKQFFPQEHSEKENIPFWLPNLTITNHKIKGEKLIKFLEVLLDENVTWKKQLKYIENKWAKILAFYTNQSSNWIKDAY